MLSIDEVKSILKPQFDDFLAKSREKGGEVLWAHNFTLWSIASKILKFIPRFDEKKRRLLEITVLIHDIGKMTEKNQSILSGESGGKVKHTQSKDQINDYFQRNGLIELFSLSEGDIDFIYHAHLHHDLPDEALRTAPPSLAAYTDIVRYANWLSSQERLDRRLIQRISSSLEPFCQITAVTISRPEGPSKYLLFDTAGRNLRCIDCYHIMGNVSRRYLLNKTMEREVCFQCHPQKKGDMFRSPHLSHDEAKMTCSTCHAPHGSDTPGLLSASSINENCYKCHPDKRGPYLFDHLPVQENCLLCHEPHTSVHRSLLKVRQPFLCLECHTNLPVQGAGMPDPHNVLDPRSRYTYNRGCTNCHPMIHGSKHPSGARLQR